MGKFFIGRPIVAIVISILIVMIGVATMLSLSVEQYPFLAPPNIRVTANYPGAAAEAVEGSVATPIEQEVNGVDNLIYMKSSNTSDGRMLLDVNFQVGMDQDTANVLTQNRVSSAQARLPAEVTQQGVTVKNQSPSILMLISLYSPKDSYDANFLINYCGINLRDQLLRIPGIAQVDLFGGTYYGMRIWLRPDKLAKLGLTAADVIASIKEQNLQAPAGRIGMAPSPKGQQFTYTVAAPGRLVTTEEFENIIIRGTETGAQVRIRDVGRAELGAQDYNAVGRGLHPRDPQDVRRGDHPGDARGVHIPPKCPGHVRPAADGAGFAHRNVHLLPAPRLLRQHAVDVRAGARNRHRGGRRHRCRRGRDAPHRARARPGGGDPAGDEGGLRARDRDRADPVRGVHPGRLRAWPHRPHVPAVRAHHRDLGAALGLQRAVAVPGPLGDAAEAGQADARSARRLLPRVQPGVRLDHRSLRRRGAHPGAARRADDHAGGRGHPGRRPDRPPAAGRLHPRGG